MNALRIKTLRSILQSRAGFATVQGLILSAAAFAAWHSSQDSNQRPLLPAFNDRPRVVRPEYDYPFVVTDQQLAEVLAKTRPRFIDQPTKVNFVDHAIRMWGATVEFPDDSLSGRQMLEQLTDHQAFSAVWGNTIPLLEPTKNGVTVTTQQGKSSVSHVDHLMGTLAEIGVPLSYPIQTTQGTSTVRLVLENAILGFRLNQREYEWTALAAAFYATSGAAWYSMEGQQIDFNQMADRLMRQPQPEGVCYGQHRLYTLTMLLRIDDQIRAENSPGLLDPASRRAVSDYLLGMTQRLYHSQSSQGYWDGNWPDSSGAIPDPSTDELSRRILATGHVLEWWAMAPAELHPPRASIINAAQWLAREISVMDPHKIEKNFTFLTHAARALALWRGGFPAEFESQSAAKPSITDSISLPQSVTQFDPLKLGNNTESLPVSIDQGNQYGT